MNDRLLLVVLVCSACVTSRSTGTLTGTWTGAMRSPHATGVRIILEEQDGALAGQAFFEDSVSHEFAWSGSLSGTHAHPLATWTLISNVSVSGKVDGDTFIGVIRFPPDRDEPAHEAELLLTR